MNTENIQENSEPVTEALYTLFEAEEPLTAKELMDRNDKVSEGWRKASYLSETLSRNSKKEEDDDEALIIKLSQETGKANKYKLTELGKRKVRKQLVTTAKKVDKDKLTYSSHQDRVNAIVAYIEDSDEMTGQIKQIELGGTSFVEIDYKRLEKFSIDLADDLIDNPKQSEDAWKEAVTEFIVRELNDSIEIRIDNVYKIDTKTINTIKSRDLNKLTMIRGIIKNVTAPRTELVRATFKCTQCGEQYNRDQDGNTLKSPYKCECGCRKFEPVKKHHKTVRMVSLKSNSDQQTSHDFLVKLVGSLAEDKYDIINNIGQQVTVVGHLDTREKGRNAMTLDFYMKANNIILEEDKWNEPEINREREEELHQLAEEQGEEINTHLAKSLGSEKFIGNTLYREGLILYLLGRSKRYGNLHILVVGDPGTAKTHMAKHLKKGYGKIIDSVATGASGVGLTAAVRRDEKTGDYVAEAGALPMADGGFHITDETDKLDDAHYKHYNEVLSDGTISIDKAGLSVKLPADVSELSIANPLDRKFKSSKDKYRQIPIDDEDLLSRYGLIIGIEDNKSGTQRARIEEGKKFWKIISRNNDDIGEPPEEIREEMKEEEEGLSPDELVFDFLHYASRINPDWSAEASNLLYQIYLDMWSQQGEDESMIQTRDINTLGQISEAYAKMELSDTVEERHTKKALEMYRKCFESIDFHIGKDDFSEMTFNPRRKLSLVRSKLNELLKSSEDDKIKVQTVVADIEQLTESEVKECIDNLKSQGELFEPEKGYLQKG